MAKSASDVPITSTPWYVIWTPATIVEPESTGGTTLYWGWKIKSAAAETAIEMPTVATSVELSKPGLPMTGRMNTIGMAYANAAAARTPNGRATRIGRWRNATTQ